MMHHRPKEVVEWWSEQHLALDLPPFRAFTAAVHEMQKPHDRNFLGVEVMPKNFATKNLR